MSAVRPRRARSFLARGLSWARAGCAALACLAAAPPESAHACVRTPQFVEPPARDAVIPGNLVFFRVLTESPGVELTLVDAESGAQIPSSVVTRAGDRLLVPDADIEAG